MRKSCLAPSRSPPQDPRNPAPNSGKHTNSPAIPSCTMAPSGTRRHPPTAWSVLSHPSTLVILSAAGLPLGTKNHPPHPTLDQSHPSSLVILSVAKNQPTYPIVGQSLRSPVVTLSTMPTKHAEEPPRRSSQPRRGETSVAQGVSPVDHRQINPKPHRGDTRHAFAAVTEHSEQQFNRSSLPSIDDEYAP